MNLIAWVRGKIKERRTNVIHVIAPRKQWIHGNNTRNEYGILEGYTRILSEQERIYLDQARNNWLSEDWTALAAMNCDDYENHPERAKLALLNAAGHFQVGCVVEARQITNAAINWGVNHHQLKEVLVKGIEVSTLLAARIFKL